MDVEGSKWKRDTPLVKDSVGGCKQDCSARNVGTGHKDMGGTVGWYVGIVGNKQLVQLSIA